MLCWCKELLRASQLYDVVFASLFTYDFDENLLKAFYECWSSMTNTLHTSVGEISITPWDLHTLGRLPCARSFYDEVVPCAMELEGANEQGQPFLPLSCRYLIRAYRHLQHSMKGQGRVSVNAWITFWFTMNLRYRYAKMQKKKTIIPKKSQNPSGTIRKEHGSWSDKEHTFFKDLEIRDVLWAKTYLEALLSCWLCIFVFPIKDLKSIHPGTFKVASLMASGRSFGLAVLVLASIYHGLNTICSSPTLSKTNGSGFAGHYVYAWIAHFFSSH